MFDTDAGSIVVFPRIALGLIGREAHVLVVRMRKAFHRWKFPAPCLATHENAFTHMCDNWEITSKTRNVAVKMKNKANNCFQ